VRGLTWPPARGVQLADLQFSAGDALAALGLPPPPKPKPKEPEPEPEPEPPVDEKTRRMTALLAMSTEPPGPTKAELAQQQVRCFSTVGVGGFGEMPQRNEGFAVTSWTLSA